MKVASVAVGTLCVFRGEVSGALGDGELSFGVTCAAGGREALAEVAGGVGCEREPKNRLKKLIDLSQQAR